MSAEIAGAGIWAVIKPYVMSLLILPIMGWFWRDRQKDSQDIRTLKEDVTNHGSIIKQLQDDSKETQRKLEKALERVDTKMEKLDSMQMDVLVKVTRLAALAEKKYNQN